jgi:F0F1-type ATP synthase membrane subunit a
MMASLAGILLVALRRPQRDVRAFQAGLEIVVLAITSQPRDFPGRNPQPFLPSLGSFFLFLCPVNLLAVFPGTATPKGPTQEARAARSRLVDASVAEFGGTQPAGGS